MCPCLYFLEGMGGQKMLERWWWWSTTGGTGFKEIRSGLSNNWPAPIVALFWGLLAVLEVHALNLGKQLVSSSHARQGWWCSTPPTSRPETTTKERKLGAETENRDRPKYCPDVAFRDLVARALQSWDRPGRLGARWMCSPISWHFSNIVLSSIFQLPRLSFVFLLLHSLSVDSFSRGSPESACEEDMRPRHGFATQVILPTKNLVTHAFCGHSHGSTCVIKHWAWILV